jgi:hypothetical protein
MKMFSLLVLFTAATILSALLVEFVGGFLSILQIP